MMDLSKKGWLKSAIRHHLSLNTTTCPENYRYPDEPIYHLIPPTGLVYDMPATTGKNKQVYEAGRFKLHLIRGIVNIYKLSQTKKDPYDPGRCTHCIYTFYKGIFPGLAIKRRSWPGKTKSFWSSCEFIINRRMDSLIKVKKNDIAAAFFDNAQLFVDAYLFRLYCTAEGNEMLLAHLRNQRDEITLTILKVIAAVSHAHDPVAPAEQVLFELFIKNSKLPEVKKRAAQEYLVHGVSVQKIMIADPGSWALKKLLLEVAILTAWSEKEPGKQELSCINDFGDMLGLTRMDKDLSMLTVEGFFLNTWDEQCGEVGVAKEEALRQTFMKRLGQLLLAHEDEMVYKITQNHRLAGLLRRASVSELYPGEKNSVHLSLVQEIESLPMFRATKLPSRFLTYPRLSSILPKKIAQRILSE